MPILVVRRAPCTTLARLCAGEPGGCVLACVQVCTDGNLSLTRMGHSQIARRAALRCHPDRHRASAPAEALAAASRWREVSDAYARICSTGEARAVARRAGGVRQGAHFHRGGRQADASQGGDVRLLALMLTSGAVFMAAPVRRRNFLMHACGLTTRVRAIVLTSSVNAPIRQYFLFSGERRSGRRRRGDSDRLSALPSSTRVRGRAMPSSSAASGGTKRRGSGFASSGVG